MSFGSSHDIKEQVRQATDLIDLVSRSIRLRRQGKIYVGLCPWHDDARPSLQVNPQRRTWKCWVCDIGGDAFSFVMKREGVEFPEALRILADRAGIVLTPAGQKRAEPGSPEDKQTLYRAMAWAEEQFHRCLLDTREAAAGRQYLAERGISDESMRRFHLGFSPDSWQWLIDRARTTPFSPAVLEAAGLASRSQDGRRLYDRFRGRLIFSIRDTEHRPIAFGARILPTATGDHAAAAHDGPKYVNSPETRLFSKSNNLYALDIVRETLASNPQIVVVEGYTDVIMAHQHGICNVVAALGTALGERHVRLLQRFAEQITLVLDGDAAGQRRTNEILELFIAAQVDLQILTPPGGLDPCDFIRQHGADAFRELLGQAVDALQHKVRAVLDGVDVVQHPDRAHRALEEIIKTLANAPRLSDAASQSSRLREQQMLVRLARQFHVEETTIRARLDELRRNRQKPGAAAVPMNDVNPLVPMELELFQVLLAHPELAETALEQIRGEQLSSKLAHHIWQLYQRAQHEEIGFEYEQIMTVAEDAALKSVLVRLYEDACGKAAAALEDADQRLQGLIRDLHFQRERSAQRHTLATLEERGYDEEEELEVLERIIQNERDRQGISAPTDG